MGESVNKGSYMPHKIVFVYIKISNTNFLLHDHRSGNSDKPYMVEKYVNVEFSKKIVTIYLKKCHLTKFFAQSIQFNFLRRN